MHSFLVGVNVAGGSEQLKDQELLSHLLNNLASLSGSVDRNMLTGLFQSSQGRENLRASAGTSDAVHTSVEMPQKGSTVEASLGEQAVPCNRPTTLKHVQEAIPAEKYELSPLKQILPNMEGARIRSFDLNDVCSDGPESTEEPDRLFIPESRQQDSPYHLPWAAQKSDRTSPSKASGFSDSASARPLFTLNGGVQVYFFSQFPKEILLPL